MTSRRVERTWIRTGGYRRLRDEWVKNLNQNISSGRTLCLYQSETYRWLACEMSAIFQELVQSVERSGSAILGAEPTLMTLK